MEQRDLDLGEAGIGQLLVPVEDFDKGVAFYRDVLGLEFLFSAPPQMAFFQCGTVRLLVGVMPRRPKPSFGWRSSPTRMATRLR